MSWVGVTIVDPGFREDVEVQLKDKLRAESTGVQVLGFHNGGLALQAISEQEHQAFFSMAAEQLLIIYKIGNTYINSVDDVVNIVRAAKPGTFLMFHFAIVTGPPDDLIVIPRQVEITVGEISSADLEHKVKYEEGISLKYRVAVLQTKDSFADSVG